MCTHRTPSRARPEKDTQERNRMPVSDKRSPLGRQLLSTTAERQAKEIQRLRRNERTMRNQTRRDDRKIKSGDRGGKSKIKRGRRLRRPQNLVCSKQRKGEVKIIYSESVPTPISILSLSTHLIHNVFCVNCSNSSRYSLYIALASALNFSNIF